MSKTAATPGSRSETLAKIRELTKQIDFCMLTTEVDGKLRSRPMSTNGEVEFDGDLWFFTYGKSHKVEEIEGEPHVNASFSDTKSHVYISMSGTAKLVRDREKIKELWRPSLKLWFPKGVDEPDIALIKVHVDFVEYWDNSKNWLAQTFEMTKALVTGTQPDLGENKKLAL